MKVNTFQFIVETVTLGIAVLLEKYLFSKLSIEFSFECSRVQKIAFCDCCR